MSAMDIFRDCLDYGLLTANLYVLIRIRISKEETFRTPFFYWFFLTGMTSSLSVVGFIIGTRQTHPASRDYGFKIGYMINSFGTTFAIIGKAYILLHRYSVMKSTSFVENITSDLAPYSEDMQELLFVLGAKERIWSRKVSYILTAITFLLSIAAPAPVIWCCLTYQIKNGESVVLYMDYTCTLTQKIRSSAVYFLYVIISIVLTVLTSREFMKLSGMVEGSTKKAIMHTQRNMFIIVSICTVTQMLKAINQFCWVFVAIFDLKEFNIFLNNTYDVAHYLATYSATVSLIIFNKKARRLMYSTNLRAPLASDSSAVLPVVPTHHSGQKA